MLREENRDISASSFVIRLNKDDIWYLDICIAHHGALKSYKFHHYEYRE